VVEVRDKPGHSLYSKFTVLKVSMDKYSDRGKQVMWSSMHCVKSISNVYVVLSAKANLPPLISLCEFACT
jgi:hypothetical protein